MYGGCRVPAREGVQLSSVLQLSLDSGHQLYPTHTVTVQRSLRQYAEVATLHQPYTNPPP